MDCRALVCDVDSDCPVVDGVTRTCTRSLCVDASKPLGRKDLVMLCMAGTGTGHDTVMQRERYALALGATESAPVPAACRQP